MNNIFTGLILVLLGFSNIALAQSSLPQCKGTNSYQWTDCFSTEENESGKYEGEYKNGNWHGQGTYTWTDGDTYIGEFRDGNINGQGTMIFANKATYIGEFRDGKKHGQGTMIFTSGSKYVGEHRDGKKYGQGTYTWANGDTYVGEWKDDYRNGYGTYTAANGDKYVGEIRNNKPNGQGTFTLADGTVEEGIWEDGKLVQLTSNLSFDGDLKEQLLKLKELYEDNVISQEDYEKYKTKLLDENILQGKSSDKQPDASKTVTDTQIKSTNSAPEKSIEKADFPNAEYLSDELSLGNDIFKYTFINSDDVLGLNQYQITPEIEYQNLYNGCLQQRYSEKRIQLYSDDIIKYNLLTDNGTLKPDKPSGISGNNYSNAVTLYHFKTECVCQTVNFTKNIIEYLESYISFRKMLNLEPKKTIVKLEYNDRFDLIHPAFIIQSELNSALKASRKKPKKMDMTYGISNFIASVEGWYQKTIKSSKNPDLDIAKISWAGSNLSCSQIKQEIGKNRFEEMYAPFLFWN